MVILKKALWYLWSANAWTHTNGRKSQQLNYHKLKQRKIAEYDSTSVFGPGP